jgi:hypothetical protein
MLLLAAVLSLSAVASEPYLVKDVVPDDPYSIVMPLGPVGNSMLFEVTPSYGHGPTTLYRTDGTESGTVAFQNALEPGLDGNRVTFTWHGAPYLFTGYDLYRIDPDGAHNVVRGAQSYAAVPDAIYALDGTDGLVRYDGITSTRTALPLYPALCDYYGRPYVMVASTLYAIRNGRLVPIRSFPSGGGAHVAGGFIYFFCASATAGKVELWRSDGTYDGCELVTTIDGSLTGDSLTAGPRLFFTTNRGLMCTDGTAAGTTLAVDVSNAHPAVAFGDQMLYFNLDGSQNVRVGITDGTLTSIRLLKILTHGVQTPYISSFTYLEGKAYFMATGYPSARLWETDGTPEGTRMSSEALVLNQNIPQQLQTLGARLYFPADDGTHGPELWALNADTVNRLTINELRVIQGDVAHFVLRLTNPKTSQVAVDYGTREMTAKAGADFIPQAGTVVFQPGETEKEIAIGTIATGKHANSVFRIQLSNPRGAAIDRAIGSAVIEGPPPPADLVLTEAHINTPTPNATFTAAARNDGPGSVADGMVTFGLVPDGTNTHASGELAAMGPGGLPVSAKSALNLIGVRSNVAWYATATSTGDPNAANNTIVGRLSMNGLGDLVSYAPAEIHPGGTTLLHVCASSVTGFTATSSNPAVATIGALTVVSLQHSVATLTAIAPGTTTISINGTNVPIRVDVLPDGEKLRLPTIVDCCQSRSDNRAGISQLFTGSIPSRAPNGAEPTGTLTFTEGSTTIGTMSVSGQQFSAALDLGAAGDHKVNVTYSGDANFEPSAALVSWRLNLGTPAIGITPSPNGVTITLNGTPRATPTGQITVSDERHQITPATHSLAQSRPGSASTTFDAHLTPGPNTITVQYGGDPNYAPVTVTYPLTVRTRAAGH